MVKQTTRRKTRSDQVDQVKFKRKAPPKSDKPRVFTNIKADLVLNTSKVRNDILYNVKKNSPKDSIRIGNGTVVYFAGALEALIKILLAKAHIYKPHDSTEGKKIVRHMLLSKHVASMLTADDNTYLHDVSPNTITNLHKVKNAPELSSRIVRDEEDIQIDEENKVKRQEAREQKKVEKEKKELQTLKNKKEKEKQEKAKNKANKAGSKKNKSKKNKRKADSDDEDDDDESDSDDDNKKEKKKTSKKSKKSKSKKK